MKSEADKVRFEITRLKAKIQKLESEISFIREKCLHPNAVKTHKSNTGNYDPSCDCYWTEFKCPDCEKFWRMEGSV